MKKYFDWASRLDRYFQDCTNRSFKYGVFDCALFAADGIKAMTGVDVAGSFRGGLYCNLAGAQEAIKTASAQFTGKGVGNEFRGFCEGLAARYGILEVPRGFQGRGDIALIRNRRGFALGLIDLSGMKIATVTKNGLDSLPMKRGAMFWSIK